MTSIVSALLALSACGAPISNADLYAEARFLRALPTSERFGAPSAVLLAPKGDSNVLASAKSAAATWDAWWSIAIAGGERLKESDPSEESEISRVWYAQEVATRKAGAVMGFGEDTLVYWVQGEILLADEETSWTLSVAPSEEGPWTGVGEGLDRGGSGEIDWDLSAAARALGGEPPIPLGLVSADYEDSTSATDGLRSVDAAVTPLPELSYDFNLRGDSLFGYIGSVSITSDGLPWPAQIVVYHEEGGGRAQGTVVAGEYTETTTAPPLLEFQSCWDSSGNLVWQAGDAGIIARGASVDCPVADVF